MEAHKLIKIKMTS